MHMIVVVFRLSRWDSNTGTPRPPSLLPIRSATAVTKLVITPSAEFFANIGGFIGWFYYSRDEWNWTNTVKLVFAKPCQGPQKGIQKNLEVCFPNISGQVKIYWYQTSVCWNISMLHYWGTNHPKSIVQVHPWRTAAQWQNPIFPASKHVVFLEVATALRFSKRKYRSCAQT